MARAKARGRRQRGVSEELKGSQCGRDTEQEVGAGHAGSEAVEELVGFLLVGSGGLWRMFNNGFPWGKVPGSWASGLKEKHTEWV